MVPKTTTIAIKMCSRDYENCPCFVRRRDDKEWVAIYPCVHIKVGSGICVLATPAKETVR